jgi:predicted MFS family arabinose efflux permease
VSASGAAGVGPGAVPGPGRALAPPGIHPAWKVLAASIAIIMMGSGAIFALAIFLRPLEDEFGWSRSLISGIALVNWIVFGAGSLAWGALSDRAGSRRVVATGAAILGVAMVVSSQVAAAWQLYLAFGILGALGASAFYVPLSATTTRWFVARRGLALGLANSGMGMGILVVPPLARALITALGWRLTFATFGVLTWLLVAVALRWLRDRPGDIGVPPYGGLAAAGAGGRDGAPAAAVIRHPAFWLIALVHFGCCAAHSGPIFHMAAHAMDQGVARMAAATILGLSGATSIAGRVGSGLLADRVGGKPALLAMLTVQALALSTYLVAAGGGVLVWTALAFGVAYGGAMPLYALVAREYFGDRVIGAAFGGIFFLSCIGMGLGAYGGGLLFDRFGSYWSLHLSSTLVGAAAVAVAIALRPPRPPRAAAHCGAGGVPPGPSGGAARGGEAAGTGVEVVDSRPGRVL